MAWDVRAGGFAHARDLVHGAVELEELASGWVRPWRFSAAQRRALASCLAWYPGIYRQMARCTAGMRLEFETDATQVLVEVRADAEPRATRNVLRGMKPEVGDATGAHDGLSFDVDGKHQGRVALAADVSDVPGEPGPGIVLDLGDFKARGSLVQLPGFGDAHRVRVWLPALRGCELGRVVGNGTFVRPVSGPAPDVLLVLGDSVAQGFTTDDPALAWPSLVADELGCDLVNQSVGAQVFQESSLSTLPDELAPSLVIVALGANYRYGRCNERVVGREIAGYLARVDELWPSVPVLVMVPAAQPGREPVAGSCFDRVGELIDAAAARVRARRMAGDAPALLVVRAPALDEAQLSDVDGHPTAAGAAALARFVLGELPKLSCRCLRETGRFGCCGACAQTGTKLHGANSSQNGKPSQAGEKRSHSEESAARPKPAKPAVEETPVGQTISMFTLLDE